MSWDKMLIKIKIKNKTYIPSLKKGEEVKHMGHIKCLTEQGGLVARAAGKSTGYLVMRSRCSIECLLLHGRDEQIETEQQIKIASTSVHG